MLEIEQSNRKFKKQVYLSITRKIENMMKMLDAKKMNEKNKKNNYHYEEKKTRDFFFKAMPSQESSKNKFTQVLPER